MRFFKYLVVLFVSIISHSTFAAVKYYVNSGSLFDSADAACVASFGAGSKAIPNYAVIPGVGIRYGHCQRANGSGASDVFQIEKEVCLEKGWPIAYEFDQSTGIPLRVCEKKGSEYCIYSRSEGSPVINLQSGRQRVILSSDGEIPKPSCTELKEGQCDPKDPYGKCYTPPNDGCTRQKDGSIVCPDETPPPQLDPGCENGATYCKRPPQGCGSGYVTGSFNGEQLCVKKGPNTPPNPDKPNECTTANCPKPDDGYDCPVGYYATTFNGQKICVKDNPNNTTDPKDPTNNPNDPNSNGGNNGGNNGGDNGGNTGGGDGNGNTGGTGEDGIFCDSSGKALCDAVNEIKDGLKKVFSDEGKEAIEALGEPSNDQRLTDADTAAQTQLQKLANVLSYSSNHQCVSDFRITDIPIVGSITVPISKWCDLLALVKLLLKLSTLMLAFRMLDATVRAF